jgi:hypothetical protein
MDGSAGAEFIEANTNAQVKSLLFPDAIDRSASYLWDRSNCALGGLFSPQSETTGLRIQVTTFRCGGFSIAVDADHALADGYSVTLFMHTWSYEHSGGPGIPPPPFNRVDPVFDPSLDRSIVDRLPTLGPGFRGTLPLTFPETHTTQDALVPAYLHISMDDFARMTRAVQSESGEPSMTQITAWCGILWAVINRTRKAHGLEPTRQVQVARSMRPDLGISDQALGCPVLIIIVEADPETADKAMAGELAALISNVTTQYSREAMLAISHDAMTRDSPMGKRRIPSPPSCLLFLPGFDPASAEYLQFAGVRCCSLLPVHMQRQGNIMIRNAADGVNVCFHLPMDQLSTFVRDPALSCVRLVSDMF